MKSGNLVTRELSREILKDVLLSYANENKVILLDGYPRSMENIDDWDNYMIKIAEIKAAIYLNCKIEAMKIRLKQRNEGRNDDNDEIINNRINIFKTETLPIIALYKEKNILLEINSNLNIEKVYNDIISRINKLNI